MTLLLVFGFVVPDGIITFGFIKELGGVYNYHASADERK
jgi:hypothetical protein